MLETYQVKLPKAVYAGADAGKQLIGLLKQFAPRKVALFTDKSVYTLGLAQVFIDQIEQYGAELAVQYDLAIEPSYEQVQAMVDWFMHQDADLILAVGGGSVMDAAKLVSVAATTDYTVYDLLKDPGRATKHVPTIMAPTTAGTGAEATPNAIVAVPEEKLKVGIVSDAMMADAIILEASLIARLPRPIAAATGIDALCHAIECYTSTKANPISDTFALEAFDLILNNIEDACDHEDALAAKQAMQLGSFLAGIAITASGTTGVHALSYPLGGTFHVAHGVSNALLLMPVMRFNQPAIEQRLAQAYDRACRGGRAVEDRGAAPHLSDAQKAEALIGRMQHIVEHLNIPRSLSELGITEVDVEQLADAGMSVTRLLVNNAREITRADAIAIYQQVV